MNISTTYPWINKEVSEMEKWELKQALSFAEEALEKYKRMKRMGYDSYELNPKIKSLALRKKNIKEAIKAIK